jgi:probable HAF family extracellular repeat protein
MALPAPTSLGMLHLRSVCVQAIPGLGLAALLSNPALAQPRFTITELPTLGGVGSRGVAVNRAGLVCGESNRLNEGYMVATAWLPPAYNPVYLTGSGGSVATGSSVNESGWIVGYSDVLENAYRAAPPGIPPAIIGEMGTHGGIAACITEHGDLCGSWGNANGTQPFMIRAGVFSALPLLEGGTQGAAAAINEAGLAVGWSGQGPNGGFYRAAKWENGVVSQLAGGDSLNAAFSVNDEGWIVGYTSDPSFPPEVATLWIDAQHPIDLGTLVPSHWQNWAYAINNRRQIVGTSGDHAFLWENGRIQDLQALIPADNWLLYSANGISDNGLIVGEGLHNGVVRGFLLTPTAPNCSADFNADGDSGTDADIEAFFACLAGSCCFPCGTADFNNDGDFGTDADIESFFRVLAGGSC